MKGSEQRWAPRHQCKPALELGGKEFMGVVPIPASIWLMGAGMVGLIGIRRRFTS